MNYVEIIARQEELQNELNELQQTRIEAAQSHTSLVTDHTVGDLEIGLDLNYDDMDAQVLTLKDRCGDILMLDVEQFNEIGMFLQKYNDAIFSYMSELKKVDEDKAEVVEDASEDSINEST